MKKIRFVCDFCSKEITGEGMRLIRVSFEKDGTFTEPDNACEFHFCKKCNASLMAELDKAEYVKTKNKALGIKDKEKSPDKSSGKRLDAGKVMALSKAGWSNEKIAEEMKVTEEQIYKCIYYQKNKQSKSQTGKENNEE